VKAEERVGRRGSGGGREEGSFVGSPDNDGVSKEEKKRWVNLTPGGRSRGGLKRGKGGLLTAQVTGRNSAEIE